MNAEDAKIYSATSQQADENTEFMVPSNDEEK